MWPGRPEEWGRGSYRDVPICKLARLARERQVRDLKRAAADDPSFPYYFDEKEADRVVQFFETRLRHTKGKWRGKPFALVDWQEWDIVRPLFGWKRKADGLRRFRRFTILIPRKCGKSALAAGFALYMVAADCEGGAQGFCAATKEDQAKIVFDEARKMVRMDPLLSREFRVGQKILYCDQLDSFLKPLGGDSETQDGLDVHFGIIDEYHAHKTNGMLGVLETAIGARSQPLIGIISTAGLDNYQPCVDEEDFCRAILEGRIENDEVFAYMTTVDAATKWDDPAEWQKANPMLGISLSFEDFEAQVRKAKQKPSDKAEFLVKRLNIRTSSGQVFLPREKWEECSTAIDWSKFKGRRCFAAFDLGLSRDLAALVLAFMDEKSAEERKPGELADVFLRPFFFMPREGFQERKGSSEHGADYATWVDRGFIDLTDGATTRIDFIRNKIQALGKEYEIAEITGDQWQAAHLMQKLADEDGFVVTKHAQGMAGMTLPCRMFEDLVMNQRIRHDGNAVLSWMIGNAVANRGGDNLMKLDKKKSKARIDGVVASVMACGRLLIAPEPVRSVYETQGLFVLG